MQRITLFATGIALATTLASGCDREADPLLCGDLGAGELVITEVRGGPDITDVHGQWIEVYNAAGGGVDLHGVALTIESIGGGTDERVLIRRPLTVAAGAYVVIGKFSDTGRPLHVDVGWGTTPGLPRDGALTLSCGTSDLDRLPYAMLPDPARIAGAPQDPPPANHGTYQLGLVPPTATGNDDPANWCPDATETVGAGFKDFEGSPGEPNPGCTP